ncbi:Thioesterase/thiol ester dehydrase-isomerase [Xylariomycetidae sp. FL0641]|nr:Thioesterase/thiol ester dehydrase-isomerase [Xylariomycetidae sp. FL0641]
MSSQAPIEASIAVVPSPDVGPDVYTNKNPLPAQDGGRALFGGFLVSQAASAASATVAEGFYLYSSQSSFLAPSQGQNRMIYRVDRTFDGRGFSTRVVRAIQNELCTYIAVISFQNSVGSAGNVLKYGPAVPDLDGMQPDDIDPGEMQKLQANILDRSVPLVQFSAEDRPLDWRPVGMDMSDDPSQFRLRGFVRSPAAVSTDSPTTHLAAFAYMSDEFSFGPALAANPMQVGKRMKNVAIGASLTHNVSFHDPQARVDKWIVLERGTTWGADGRVLVDQKMWDMESGRLVMSGTQEALIRLRGPKL